MADAPVAQAKIVSFMMVTGATAEDADIFLRRTGSDVQVAVNHYFDAPDGAPPAPPAPQHAKAAPAAPANVKAKAPAPAGQNVPAPAVNPAAASVVPAPVVEAAPAPAADEPVAAKAAAKKPQPKAKKAAPKKAAGMKKAPVKRGRAKVSDDDDDDANNGDTEDESSDSSSDDEGDDYDSDDDDAFAAKKPAAKKAAAKKPAGGGAAAAAKPAGKQGPARYTGIPGDVPHEASGGAPAMKALDVTDADVPAALERVSKACDDMMAADLNVDDAARASNGDDADAAAGLCVAYETYVKLDCIAAVLRADFPSVVANARSQHVKFLETAATLLAVHCATGQQVNTAFGSALANELRGPVLKRRLEKQIVVPVPDEDAVTEATHSLGECHHPAAKACAAGNHMVVVMLYALQKIGGAVVRAVEIDTAGGMRFKLQVCISTTRSAANEEHAEFNKLRRQFLRLLMRVMGFVTVDDEGDCKPYPNFDPADSDALRATARPLATPAAMLKLFSVPEDNGIEPVGAEVAGITLRLKTHQRESVAWMLERELEGTQDMVTIRGVGCTVHFNVLACHVIAVPDSDPAHALKNKQANPTRRGGFLADEMGLGKTLAVLSVVAMNPADPAALVATHTLAPHLQWELFQKSASGRVVRPFDRSTVANPADARTLDRAAYDARHERRAVKATLVVVPVTLVGQWETEIARCSPGLRVLVFHGAARKKFTADDVALADVILTTYETLKVDLKELQKNLPRRFVKLVLPAKQATRLRAQYAKQQADKFAAAGAKTPKAKKEHILPEAARIVDHCFTPPTAARLTDLHFHRVVFDECQKQDGGDDRGLSAANVWFVSGTPISNNKFAPLAKCMSFLGHQPYSRAKFFEVSDAPPGGQDGYKEKTNYWNEDVALVQAHIAGHAQVAAGDSADGTSVMPTAKHALSPGASWPLLVVAKQYVVRHVKTETIVAELALPRRTVVVRPVHLLAAERALYDRVQERIQKDVKSLRDRNRLGNRISSVMQWLLTMQRAAAHPGLLREDDMADDAGAVGGAAAASDSTKLGTVHELSAQAVLGKLKDSRAPTSLIDALKLMAGDPPEVDVCGVCLEPLDQPLLFACHHIFCKECVLSVIGTATRGGQVPKCPSCRASIAGPKTAIAVRAAPAAADIVGDGDFQQQIAAIGAGSKIASTLQLMAEVLAADATAKFVVFSSMPEIMKRTVAAMAGTDITSILIDGSTSLARRKKLIHQFQTDQTTKVCVISSRVGNAGLTLTAANHLILMEPNQNNAVTDQAMARIHRLGQLRPVTIHRLAAVNTIEERILGIVTHEAAGDVAVGGGETNERMLRFLFADLPPAGAAAAAGADE
jgi:SNF2 family DNA or RNA helicase